MSDELSPPHHLPPFRPPEPKPGELIDLLLNELLTLLAEIRLDLQTRKDYAMQIEIRVREQDRRLELAYMRLSDFLRKK